MVKLADAVVLISNDDGIHAPGLHVLEDAVAPLVDAMVTVAPETEQSASSHSLTLRRPLRIREQSPGRFAVDGTPTDSVLLGFMEVFGSEKPDLVLSGVNRGGNLGEDVIYSGTVAAAMEGALIGIPAIAFSQVYDDNRNVEWDTSRHWVPKVLAALEDYPWTPGTVLNVNIPNIPAEQVTGIQVARQGRRKIGGNIQKGRDPRGEAYYWVGFQRDEEKYVEGTDLEVCRQGAIAVTALSTDLTEAEGQVRLKELLA